MAVQGAEVSERASADPPSSGDLGPRGHRARLWLALAAAGLLLYGTLFGTDDMFPFGPFHMYSEWYPPNGVVTSTAIYATTADGRNVYVTEGDTGLARGDIEGELSEFEANPGRLGDLAQSYHRRFPAASPFVDMRLVQRRWQLHDRAYVGETTVTLVEWHAPGAAPVPPTPSPSSLAETAAP
jgi:hypothetical protein